MFNSTKITIHFADFQALARLNAQLSGQAIHLKDSVIMGDGMNLATYTLAVPYGSTYREYNEYLMRIVFLKAGVKNVHTISFDMYGERDDDQSGHITKERAEEIRNTVLKLELEEK